MPLKDKCSNSNFPNIIVPNKRANSHITSVRHIQVCLTVLYFRRRRNASRFSSRSTIPAAPESLVCLVSLPLAAATEFQQNSHPGGVASLIVGYGNRLNPGAAICKYETASTTVPAASGISWNLPRPKKCPPDTFYPACGRAGLSIPTHLLPNKNSTPNGVLFLFAKEPYNGA